MAIGVDDRVQRGERADDEGKIIHQIQVVEEKTKAEKSRWGNKKSPNPRPANSSTDSTAQNRQHITGQAETERSKEDEKQREQGTQGHTHTREQSSVASFSWSSRHEWPTV